MNQFKKVASQVRRNHFGTSMRDLDLRHIEWHSSLWERPDSPLRFLPKITLSSITSLRRIFNEVGLDVLLFMTPQYKHAILSHVAEQLNHAYGQAVREYGPGGFTVSVLGHSLGSVISFELLQMQRHKPEHEEFIPLQFTPQHLFLTGSQMGLFGALRITNAVDQSIIHLPACPVYNVFHPYDPLAFRLEPMLPNAPATALEPAILPSADYDTVAERASRAVESLKKRAMSVTANILTTKKPATGPSVPPVLSGAGASVTATAVEEGSASASPSVAPVVVPTERQILDEVAKLSAARASNEPSSLGILGQLSKFTAQINASAVSDYLEKSIAEATQKEALDPKLTAAETIRSCTSATYATCTRPKSSWERARVAWGVLTPSPFSIALDLQQGRVDYALQESFDFSAIRAHSSYWESHDLALFMLHVIRGDA